MKNFHRIASGANVGPLLLALVRHPDLWDKNTLRTTHPETPHKEVSDIWLRFNRLPGKVEEIIDEHESIDYPAYGVLKEARPLIMSLMAHVQGERLGRCLITKLAPGKKIDPHVDGGSHAAYYDRFHIVLDSAPGSLFRCGDETIQMAQGDIYWFDNSIEHEVWNNSATDRLHLIVDIKMQ
jgi:hypothetical protein